MNNRPLPVPPQPNEEINLNSLFANVGAFFRRVFNSLLVIILLILRKWVFFLIIVILGAALSYLAFLLPKPYYSYSMTVLLSNVRNDFVENQLASLEASVREGNKIVVGRQLNLSVNAAEQIESISFKSLDQSIIPKDSVLTGSPFQVMVDLYDNTIEDSVENGIIHFLEHNRYFAKKKQIRKEYLESVIFKLKEDIQSIDSAKNTPISPQGPVSGFVYGEPLDPTNLYKESAELFEKQAQLESQLKDLEHFEVIVGFAPKVKPTGPKKSIFMLVGVLIALTAGVLYIKRKENKITGLA